jgi:Putative Ig domain
VLLSDHPSWHNARRDVLTPFVTALFRYGGNDVPWRAWDDELVAVETAAGHGVNATVWRFAHHRSTVAHDDDPIRNYFWYMPRPNVSQDGRWVLFTSNWEKRLGTDPGGESGGRQRQDVFLLKLRTGDGPTAPSGTLRILTTALPTGRRGQPYSATLLAAGATAVRWRVTSGTLPPGLKLDGTTGVISGTCVWSGTWTFTVTASEGTATDRRTLSLILQK